MRRLLVGTVALALLMLMAGPGLAQEGSPITEVEPSRVELPLPGTGTGTGTGTPRDQTEVLGTPLARTGFGAGASLALALGLLVAGTGALLVARKRRNAL